MLLGCCCLVFLDADFTQILALRCSKRRGFVLPGGKWEPGETFKRCAHRELYEETGLIANNSSFVYAGPNVDGFMCHTFYMFDIQNWEKLGTITEEGKPVNVVWDDLIQGSAFGAYYEVLREVWEQRCALLSRS